MALVTGVWAIEGHPNRRAVTRSSAAFDPKGVVGYVIERGGKWYIEGDEKLTPFEHENLAAGALVCSLPGE